MRESLGTVSAVTMAWTPPGNRRITSRAAISARTVTPLARGRTRNSIMRESLGTVSAVTMAWPPPGNLRITFKARIRARTATRRVAGSMCNSTIVKLWETAEAVILRTSSAMLTRKSIPLGFSTAQANCVIAPARATCTSTHPSQPSTSDVRASIRFRQGTGEP